jgi:hypothetical protein
LQIGHILIDHPRVIADETHSELNPIYELLEVFAFKASRVLLQVVTYLSAHNAVSGRA